MPVRPRFTDLMRFYSDSPDKIAYSLADPDAVVAEFTQIMDANKGNPTVLRLLDAYEELLAKAHALAGARMGASQLAEEALNVLWDIEAIIAPFAAEVNEVGGKE